jgi:hypothetical protein
MGVPSSEVGYTSATARRRDHESSYEHVALEKKNVKEILLAIPIDRWEPYEERSIHGPWFIVTREVKNEILENKKHPFVAVGFVLVPNTQT